MKLTELIKTLNDLNERHKKGVFTLNELVAFTQTTKTAAAMTLIRAMRHQMVWRVRNLWINALAPPPLEEIALALYSPSYVSFESALYRKGVLSQAPRGALTLATTKRPLVVHTPLGKIQFIHVKQNLFFGFDKERIAYVEKAFLDLAYIRGLRTKSLQFSETFYFQDLNQKKLKIFSEQFPKWLRTKIGSTKVK